MVDILLNGNCCGMRRLRATSHWAGNFSAVCRERNDHTWFYASLLAAVAVLATGCAPRGFYTVPDKMLDHPEHIGQQLSLEPYGECPPLAEEGSVVVLVHGFGGLTKNVSEVREVLENLEPSVMLSFHWSAFEESKGLVRRLTEGLNHLVECTPPGRTIVVFAHSAGGVLASMAAAEVRIDTRSGPELVVVTVASPLAGAGYSSWRLKLLPLKPFAFIVGGKVERYLAPAAGIRVVHVRTHSTGDHVMRETVTGHQPNDSRAVVPGAVLHELPDHVGHDDALLWAARVLAASPKAFGIREPRRAND